MIYIGWGEITRKQWCGFCEMDCLFVTILSNVFWLSKSEKLSTVLKYIKLMEILSQLIGGLNTLESRVKIVKLERIGKEI